LLYCGNIDLSKFYDLYDKNKARKIIKRLDLKSASELLDTDEKIISKVLGDV